MNEKYCHVSLVFGTFSEVQLIRSQPEHEQSETWF